MTWGDGRRPRPMALPAKIAPEAVSPVVVAMFAPFVLAPLVLARFAETVVVADIRTCATPIPGIESSSVGTRGDPVRTRIRRHGPVAIHPVAIAVIISVHPVITGARAWRPVGGRFRSGTDQGRVRARLGKARKV